MQKAKVFFATDADGARHRWAFRKDGEYWLLEDPDHYIRTLAKTWAESVVLIRMYLDNYGMRAAIS